MLKESQAVEKLTRITVLLAKVTILFLPISLVCAYFSMQMTQGSSLKAFWFSFLVVAVLTGVFLFGFGFLSDRYQGKVVYQSLTRIFVRRRRQKHEEKKVSM